jgi:hypothetical protein
MKALEIIISLAGIYLLYSLLGTIVQEFIAQICGLRARMLVKGIKRMLDKVSPGSPFCRFFRNPWETIKRIFNPSTYRPLTNSFYSQPSITFLGKSSFYSKPSYLEGSNFSATLLRMLRGPNFDGTQSQINLIRESIVNNHLKFDDQTLQRFRDLLAESYNDIEKFKAGIESWYNETMDRVSGWYKRQSQLILFVIGLVIAIMFNVDSIEIAGRLSKNDKLRAQMVQYAGTLSNSLKSPSNNFYSYFHTWEHPDTTKGPNSFDSINVKYEFFKLLYKQADSVNDMLGLGWIHKDTTLTAKTCSRKNAHTKHYIFNHTIPQKYPWRALLGWLLTALAISLGSPFWFDLLNKVIKLRSSGIIPGPSTSKDKSPASNTVDPLLGKG